MLMSVWVAAFTCAFPYTAIFVHLLFPDWTAILQMVDQILCGTQAFSTMGRRYRYYDARLAYRHSSSSMIDSYVHKIPLISGLIYDLLQHFGGHGDVSFIVELHYFLPFLAVWVRVCNVSQARVTLKCISCQPRECWNGTCRVHLYSMTNIL